MQIFLNFPKVKFKKNAVGYPSIMQMLFRVEIFSPSEWRKLRKVIRGIQETLFC